MSAQGRRLGALLGCVLFVTPVSAAPPEAPDPAAVDALIRDALKAWGVPGAAVAVVRDDRVIYLKGHGLREAGRLPLDRPFRTAFQYQSTMFTAAGLAAGAAANTTWADLVRKRVLDPLEMTGASLTTTEAEKAPDRAMPHRRGRDGQPEVTA